MPLFECVKEHSKVGNNSAFHQHCSTKGNQLPHIDYVIHQVIHQEVSQIALEAKEAIHIKRLDPELPKNVGKW